MLKSVQGVFRNGKIELLEAPPQTQESRVLVTFLSNTPTVNLEERGIGPEQAAELRARLKSFAEDWNDPQMDVYDEL